MKVLYSNMLPLGIQDNQETIDESIRRQIEKSDRVDIAVGYVSLASPEELDIVISESSVKQITLVIGMYYIEGMPEKIYYTVFRINKKVEGYRNMRSTNCPPFEVSRKSLLLL